MAAFDRAAGRCERKDCGAKLFAGKFHFDHVVPDALGGKPTLDNCEVLCWACHGGKTAEKDVPQIAKADRMRAKHLGLKKPTHIVPGSKASRFKKHLDGRVTLRSHADRERT